MALDIAEILRQIPGIAGLLGQDPRFNLLMNQDKIFPLTSQNGALPRAVGSLTPATSFAAPPPAPLTEGPLGQDEQLSTLPNFNIPSNLQAAPVTPATLPDFNLPEEPIPEDLSSFAGLKAAVEDIDLNLGDEIIKQALSPDTSADQFEKLLSTFALAQKFLTGPEVAPAPIAPGIPLKSGRVEILNPFQQQRGPLG